jgi:hypothetical protein
MPNKLYFCIFHQTREKIFRTWVLRFIPLKNRQKSLKSYFFPDASVSYQHTFPQVVEKSAVGLYIYTALM